MRYATLYNRVHIGLNYIIISSTYIHMHNMYAFIEYEVISLAANDGIDGRLDGRVAGVASIMNMNGNFLTLVIQN